MSRHPVDATPPAVEYAEGADQPQALVDLVNRVLDRGVVVQGDVTISVAGVDLVYLGLNALLTSISTARRTLQRPVHGSAALPPPSDRPLPDASKAETTVGSLQPTSGVQKEPGPRSAPPGGAGKHGSDALAEQLVQVAEALPPRIEVDPDGVQRDLGRLVLTLVELLRQVVEHQAVRRMEDGDLGEEQVERMGAALQSLEEKMREIKDVFGLADEDLNIDLGPLGKLL
jgi:hypothetical protein